MADSDPPPAAWVADPPGVPPEISALLRLLRSEESRAPVPLPADLDWNRLIDTALEHRLVPWLWERLESIEDLAREEALPADSLERLRNARDQNTGRALLLAAEAVRLTRAFAERKIELIHLKGPVLARVLYGRVESRQVGDLDLLVNEADRNAAREILESFGFEPWWGRDVEVDDRQAEYLLEHTSELRLRDAARRITVDLHWRLHVDCGLSVPDAEGIWERRSGVEVGGTRLSTLSDEDAFFYLALHGTKHAWERLAWILDLGRSIARVSPDRSDWQSRLERARAVGCSRPLVLGLVVAHGILGTPLPEIAATELRRDPALRGLVESAYRSISRSGARTESGTGASRFGYRLSLRRSLKYKADVVRRVLVPAYASDWDEYRLPKRLFPLYFVLRPWRLARRHLLSTVRSRRHGYSAPASPSYSNRPGNEPDVTSS